VRRVCLKGSRAAFAPRFGVWPGSGRIKALCGNEGFSVEAIHAAGLIERQDTRNATHMTKSL
jgi:hypothetical protein